MIGGGFMGVYILFVFYVGISILFNLGSNFLCVLMIKNKLLL
jgi:hypothetical protein